MIDVGLNWVRCPDGVEIVSEDAATGSGAGRRKSPYLRFRSANRVPKIIDRVNLENPVVLRFVNCRSTEKQIAFHHEFGLLQDHGGNGTEPISVISETDPTYAFNENFGSFVEKAITAPPAEKSEIVNKRLFEKAMLTPTFDFLGAGQKPRIVFAARNLLEFMATETAIAAVSGVGFVRCLSCGDAFFTGPAAHRRTDAKTCSSRCRSAYMRSHRKANAAS